MPEFVDTVGNALQGLAQVCLRVGIGKAQIAFTVHTKIDPGQGGNTAGLEEKLVALIGAAVSRLRPARVAYARGEAGFARNRRVTFTPENPYSVASRVTTAVSR